MQPPAPLADFLDRPRAELRRVAHCYPHAVWEAALSQIGKPYDWGWLFGWIIRSRRWDDPKKWVCSELVSWAMREAGDALFEGHTWHITPGDLYMMSTSLKDAK